MNTSDVILSIIGPDKPGIVSDISEIIKKYSGNIEKSRMIRLGDFFTIMMLININAKNTENLQSEFNNYSNYQISIHKSKNKIDTSDECFHTVHLNGIDNEGIVYEITNQLSELDINIEELKTNVSNAPMSGLTLFSLTAKINHPKLNYKILKMKMDELATKLDVNIIIED